MVIWDAPCSFEHRWGWWRWEDCDQRICLLKMGCSSNKEVRKDWSDNTDKADDGDVHRGVHSSSRGWNEAYLVNGILSLEVGDGIINALSQAIFSCFQSTVQQKLTIAFRSRADMVHSQISPRESWQQYNRIFPSFYLSLENEPRRGAADDHLQISSLGISYLSEKTTHYILYSLWKSCSFLVPNRMPKRSPM